MKTLKRAAFFGAVLATVTWLLAVFFPMSYLKLHAALGFGPVPLNWVISSALEDFLDVTSDFCSQPVLLSWQGSFGGGPVVPETIVLPPKTEFEELVLVNTDIVLRSTEETLAAMAEFNSELLIRCFGSAKS